MSFSWLMNQLMQPLCVNLWVPLYRHSRPRAFENDDGGALAFFRSHCRLRDWWSGGDDVGGERIGAWWGNVSAHGMG